MLTPIKTYAITLDRLEVMLKSTPDLFTPSNVDLSAITRTNALPTYKRAGVKLDRADVCKNANYHLSYAVSVDGQAFGEIYLEPTKIHQNSDLVKLRLNNQTCYTNWLPSFTSFLSALQLEVNNITYLEIALDTNTDVLSNFLHYFEDTNRYHLVSGLKPADSVDKFSRLYRNGNETASFYLGKTSKVLAMYNKSLEVLASGKDYISAYHKANGLDTTTDVYRMELRLKNNALKRSDTVYKHKHTGATISPYAFDALSNKGEPNAKYYQKHTNRTTIGNNDQTITVPDLADANKLASLFELLLPSVLEFRQTDNKKVSRCTPVPFVKFKTANVLAYITTTDKTKNNSTNMTKHFISGDLKSFAKTNKQFYQQAAYDRAKESNLLDYYESVLKQLRLDAKEAAATKQAPCLSDYFV